MGLIREAESKEWIPCSDKLPPDNKINPVTRDFCKYLVTVKIGDIYDVRCYAFGRGHWFNDCRFMDDIVIAWKPLPEPWIPEREINKKEISSDEASLKAVYNNLEIAMCILNAMIGENVGGQNEG